MWKNSTARYGSLQVALHWLMLVLLVAVYAAMELRENFPKGSDPREFMKSLHFMLGISVLILVAVRIAARLSGPTPAIVPTSADMSAGTITVRCCGDRASFSNAATYFCATK